jgi:polysaccharide export outer membrane protein
MKVNPRAACGSREERSVMSLDFVPARSAIRVLLAGLLLFALAACGSSAYTDVDLQKDLDVQHTHHLSPAAQSFASAPDTMQAPPVYRVGSGDVLEIVFFTHPAQNRFVTVRPDGRITLPYVGELMARGKEPTKLAAEIQKDYSAVLVDPKVDVLLNKIGGRFYVLGQVRNANEFQYERPLTLLQAIAKAGGYNDNARLTNFVLIRADEEGGRFAAVFNLREYMGDRQKVGDIYIQPDDILWVPKDNISRWDNVARKTFTSLLQAEDLVIKGMTIDRFDEVYSNRNFR